MSELEIKVIKKAKKETIKELKDTMKNNIMLGVGIAAVNRFEDYIVKELKNDWSTKFSN